MDGQSWVTKDDLGGLMPAAAAEGIPPPERVWTEADWDLVQRGHQSADMHDKWDAYVEGRRLYLHRSWTGWGVYEADFGPVPDGGQMTSAVVAGDRSSYHRQDDNHESALLEALIDGKLLGICDGPGHQRLARFRNERGMS